VKVGAHGGKDELEGGPALHRAGADHGPEAFAGLASLEAARALRDAPVDDDEAHGLLGEVVGRADAGRGDELEVGLAVLAEAVGHIEGFALEFLAVGVQARGHIAQRHLQDVVAGLFERALEGGRAGLVLAVDDLEHRLDRREQPLAVGARLGVGQPGQELDVADQMGDAELHRDVEILHVLVVGGKVVATEYAVELLAQHIEQHLRTAGFVDLEQHIQLGSEDPGPELLAVVLVAGFVHVERLFQRQPAEQFGVGRVQRGGGLFDDLAQVAARDVFAQHVAHELADRGEGGVIDGLHVGDQRGEPLLEQAFLDHRFGEWVIMNLAAAFAPDRIGTVLLLADDHLLDFHLLQHARRLVQEGQPGVAALRAGVEPVLVEVLDVRFREGRALVPGMAGLRADLAFALLALLRLGPCDVRRRGLAGVGGVLRELRDLALQLLDPLLQQIDLSRQLADDLDYRFRSGVINGQCLLRGDHRTTPP